MIQLKKRILVAVLALILLTSVLHPTSIASAAGRNYASLVIHDVDEGNYTLGSRNADISILIFGRITCSRTGLVQMNVEQIIADQYIRGVQVYLMDIDQPFDDVLHTARTHVISTVYAWNEDNRYIQLLWDTQGAARSFNPSTSKPELLPEVLVLDRNCNVIYAFDESVSDYKEKVEQLLAPYRSQPSEEEFAIEDGVLLKYNGHDSTPTIPPNVTAIGPFAFSGNSDISSIIIPQGVTTIGDYAFAGCYKVPNIVIPDGVTKIGAYAFLGCSQLENVEIPDSVTAIGAHAFEFCHNLIQITIPDNVAVIGDYAFYCCGNLSEVSLPKGTTHIGRGTFSRCTKLTTVSIQDSVTSIGDWAFYDCTGLTSVAIPDGVTSIGWGVFQGCSGLTSVTIPSEAASIGEMAFYECTSLTSVTIPDSVTSIGYGAFGGCTGLTSVTIPGSVTSIGGYAFSDCTGLTNVAIPDSVTYIGELAFDDCTGLTDVYYGGSESQWEAIKIAYGNKPLKNAAIHYNSPMPQQPAESTVGGFSDVKTGVWYAESVLWAVENKITIGTSDTTFSPDVDCTQSQILTFLWRAKGEPAPAGTVSGDEWYAEAAQWAVEQGLTDDLSAEADCTRAMVVTYLWKLAGSPKAASSSSFTDVPDTLADAVSWAAEQDITTGTSATTFSPDVTCTRGQIVTFLYRAFAK